jgi:hypothetical protein
MPDLITWKNLFTKGEGRLKKIINTARKGQQLNAIKKRTSYSRNPYDKIGN